MVLTGRLVHTPLAPPVSLRDPVPQRELAQLHLDVQHQAVLHLGGDTEQAPICRCAHRDLERTKAPPPAPGQALGYGLWAEALGQTGLPKKPKV